METWWGAAGGEGLEVGLPLNLMAAAPAQFRSPTLVRGYLEKPTRPRSRRGRQKSEHHSGARDFPPNEEQQETRLQVESLKKPLGSELLKASEKGAEGLGDVWIPSRPLASAALLSV